MAGVNENMLALVYQPNVSARIKAEQDDLMHMKAYAVDGRWLRTGSANFSWSGERRQDNDIVVIDSPEARGGDFPAISITSGRGATIARPHNEQKTDTRRARRRRLGNRAGQYGGLVARENLDLGA